MNSRSASAAPAARASSRPEPNEPGGLVVRDHSAAAPPVARIVPRAVSGVAVLERHAGDGVALEQGGGARALEHGDRRLLGDVGRQLAQDAAPGRAAAGVDDAARPVAALEAEGEVAVAVGVEADAERLEVAEPRGRLVGQDLGGGAAHEAAAGRQRVLEMAGRRVVDRERGREASLRPVGRRLGERAGRHERHPRSLAGRAQAGEQTGRTRAHHHEVVALGVHGRPYGTGVPPLWLRHDASLLHDIPGHPERPERIRALEAAMAQRDWFGAALLEAPRADRALLETIHPGRYVLGLEEFCAAGGGFIDADTVAVPDTFEAALRAAGGAVALVDGLLGGTGRVGVSALRPPGHHAEPGRAMGFCFFGNVAAAARRATGTHGLSRVLILDWDVHHGNGTEAIFARDSDVLFVSIHEWPLYPGTGPASYLGEGAGEGYTVNLPVPGRQRRRGVPIAGRRTWSCRCCGRGSRSSC